MLDLEHSAEHATCGVDGCSYTAHESLLEKHVRHQHLSGLFQKIPQGKNMFLPIQISINRLILPKKIGSSMIKVKE